MQLIDLIDEALKKEKDQLSLCGHKLVVTGRDQVPTEINNGIVIPRRDLETSQEEADVIIVQQMVAITEEHGGDGSESCVMILMSLCYCCTSTVS